MNLNQEELNILKHKLKENQSKANYRVYFVIFLVVGGGFTGYGQMPEGLIDTLGMNGFIITGFFIVTFWMLYFIYHYKIFGLKKDLKEKTKVRHESVVASLMETTGTINIMVNNKKHQLDVELDDFLILNINQGDIIEYEIFKNSKLLLSILQVNERKINFLNVSDYEV